MTQFSFYCMKMCSFNLVFFVSLFFFLLLYGEHMSEGRSKKISAGITIKTERFDSQQKAVDSQSCLQTH